MSLYYDHVTVIVLCDCDIMLDPTPRSPSIERKKQEKENKSGKELNKVHCLQL